MLPFRGTWTVLALAGAMVTAGCDGDIQIETGGAAGSGGSTGGSTATGGAGGADVAECPPVAAAPLGFDGAEPGSPTVTITQVTPTAIHMKADPNGPEHVFRWVGADLGALFAPGDVATLDVPDGSGQEWYVLTGDEGFAAAVAHSSIAMLLPLSYAAPHGGPEIGFTAECSVHHSCATLGECHDTTESLVVSDGQGQVTVPSEKLVTAGDYQVYNNGNFDHHVTPEATKSRSFTIVGPVK